MIFIYGLGLMLAVCVGWVLLCSAFALIVALLRLVWFAVPVAIFVAVVIVLVRFLV